MATWRTTPPTPREINTGDLFGPVWTARLRDGCAALDVDPAWVLVTLAHLSGLDPLMESSMGARGLWQSPGVHHIDPFGGKVRRLYAEKDPVKQLSDAFHHWTVQKRLFKVPGFATRAHFYCLHIAPMRLSGGKATLTTLLFPGGNQFYKQYEKLDRDKRGFIILGDLEWPLQKASQVYAQRLRRELEAVKAPIEEK